MDTQDWVDEVAIERALIGRRVGRPLTEAEGRWIADWAVVQGKGSNTVTKAVGCNGVVGRRLYDEAVQRAERAEGGAAA